MSEETTGSKKVEKKSRTVLVNSIAGLVGTCAGKSVMHPIDTIKAKLQVISIPGLNEGSQAVGKGAMSKIIRETINKEGIRGLYRGFGIHVGGSIPAGGLYYGSYEFFKKNTLKNEFLSQHAFLAYLMGGIFAETISCIIFVPVDVIKERR